MVFGDAKVIDLGDNRRWSFKGMGNGIGERQRRP
jgi:hypothetical protein